MTERKPLPTKVKSLSFLLTPILVSVFPILSFYVNNMSELAPVFLEKPLLYSVVASIILTLILYAIIKDKYKSALIATTAIFIFFSYGHLSKYLNTRLFIPMPNGAVLGPDKIMIPLILVLFPLFVYKTLKSTRNLKPYIKFLNITLILLITYLGIKIIVSEKYTPQYSTTTSKSTLNTQTKHDTPDIYYIILDGYARSDVLESVYNYDNSEFIDSLKEMGFFVAKEARSNYAHTYLSLPSTLNMTYLDSLPEKYGKDSESKSAALGMLHSNLVTQKLKDYGYTTINFASGWEGTDEHYIADINYNEKRILEVIGVDIVTNETNMVFLQTTIFSPFIKEVWGDVLRGKILYTFERLPDLPYLDVKKFTFAHILAPHPPYVFQASGKAVKNPQLDMMGGIFEDKESYIDQLTYISDQIEPTLKKIISNSNNPPIIILQSDHGPASILKHPFTWSEPYDPEGVNERMSILYAVYLPDKDYDNFNQTMTPVNTFRIIFNNYFNEDLELLPDKSYFSDYDSIYNFVDVNNTPP